MTEFPVFLSAVLTAVAAFLWMDSMKWITGLILLLGIAVFIKKLVS